MNIRLRSPLLPPVLLLLGLSPHASAEVKSLTSNELTETFIQDSTIIVTPAPQETPQAKRVVTYTISPSEQTEAQTQEHAEFLKDSEALRTSAAGAEESARQFLQSAVPNDRRPQIEAPVVINRDLNVPNVPPIQLPRGP